MDRYGYRMRAYLLHLKGLAQDLGQGLLKGRVRLAPAMARPLVHGRSLPTAPPPTPGASMLIMSGNYLDDIMDGLKTCLLSITCRSHVTPDACSMVYQFIDRLYKCCGTPCHCLSILWGDLVVGRKSL